MEPGLKRGTVRLEPHSAEWDRSAQEMLAKLRALLRGTLSDAQHIGSTAVPGICAKPIIDLAAGVRDFQELLSCNALLAENGILYRGQDFPRQHLYVCGTADFRTHHIHAVMYRSAEWFDYLGLRDYLLANPADAARYDALKRALAQQYPDDRAAYTAGKAELIAELLCRARRLRQNT